MNVYTTGIGALIVLVLLLGIEQYGEHRVQIRWDLERARDKAIADQERKNNAAANALLAEQYRKDIEYAKSQAGKSAVAAWLKSHGLLPDGAPVPGAGSCQTNSPSESNGPSSQSGAGYGVEEFAQGCALDALKLLDWQEWAMRNGLPIGGK